MRAIFFNKLGRRRITYMISIQSVKLACFVLFCFVFFVCFSVLSAYWSGCFLPKNKK